MILALLATLALQSSSPPGAPPDPASIQADLAAQDAATTLDRMHAAASRADGVVYFDQFAPDARFIGTDNTERWSLAQFRAYAEPFFAQGKGWTYRPRERSLTVSGDMAWFDEVLDNDAYGTTRGSGVLRLTDDGWKIEQYVLSFAVPNDRARAVVDAIKAD